MSDPATAIVLLQLLTLAAAGCVGCAIAHRLGTARIVGGLIGGLLIGPSLLGNVAPNAHRHLWQGGQAELRQLHDAKAAYRAAVDAANASGVTDIYIEELNAAHLPLIAAAQQSLDAAEAAHRRYADTIALVAMVVLLLAAGRDNPFASASPLFGRALPIALGSILLPAALACAAMWLLGAPGRSVESVDSISRDAITGITSDPLVHALGFAIGCGAAALPVCPRLIRRTGADADPSLVPLVRSAAAVNIAVVLLAAVALLRIAAGDPPAIAVGSTLAFAAVAFVAAAVIAHLGLRIIGSHPADDAVASIGLLLVTSLVPIAAAAVMGLPIILGALVGGLALGSLPHAPPAFSRSLALAADALALPVLCAYVGTRIDLVPQFDWLAVLVALLLFGDAKAIGSALVARLTGSTWPASFRLGSLLAAGGALPLIVALFLREAGLIDQPLFVALVLANALAAALAAPTLRLLRQVTQPSE